MTKERTMPIDQIPVEQIKTLVDYGIFGLLGVLSIITFAYAIERALFYRRVRLSTYTHSKALELDLMRRLPTIASIGSNAPYIGLLGTVLAIILTFYVIGQKGGVIEPGTIMQHLALALKATAAGLLVAIPATVIYNALLTQVDRRLAEWEILRDEGKLKGTPAP
jgi:biopolymer transport protein ExbB